MSEATMAASGEAEPGERTNFVIRVFGEDSGVRQALGLGVWFGAWTSGRLGRIGYVVAAICLYGMLGVVQWLVLDLLEPAPLQFTPNYQPMSEGARMVAVIASGGVSVLTLILGLNIAAKRIRAIGAPGWGGAVALTAIHAAALFAFPTVAYPWAALATLLALMILPNDLIKRRDGRRDGR